MSIIEKRALKVSWDEISSAVESEVDKMLGIKLKCRAKPVESGYWDVEFIDYRMPLPKLCQVLQAVEAAPDDWETVLPDEGAVDVKDIGMRVGEKLLGKHLDITWERSLIAEDGLWLVGVIGDEQQFPVNEPVTEFTLPISTRLLDAVGDMVDYLKKNSSSPE